MVFALSAVFLLAFGISFAVSRDKSIFPNNFKLGSYETLFTETFDAPSNWLTCETIDKAITATNDTDSSGPVSVRLKLEEWWVAADGVTELPLISSASGLEMAQINFVQNSGWTKNGAYYYYDTDLAKGATTSSLISGVTLNCNANLGDTEINSDSAYADGTYHLKVTAQAVEAEAKEDTWHTGYATLKSGRELNLIFKSAAAGTNVTDVTTVVNAAPLQVSGPYYRGQIDSQCESSLADKVAVTTDDSPYAIYLIKCNNMLSYYTDSDDNNGTKMNEDMSYFGSYYDDFDLDIRLFRILFDNTVDNSEVKTISHFFEGSSFMGGVNDIQNYIHPGSVAPDIDASYLLYGAESSSSNVLLAITSRLLTPSNIAISNYSHMFANMNDASGELCSLVSNGSFEFRRNTPVDLSYLFANSLASCQSSATQMHDFIITNANSDISHMFENYTNLSDVSRLNTWNINTSINMQDMFAGTSVTNYPRWYH